MLYALHELAKVKNFPTDNQVKQIKNTLGYLKHTKKMEHVFYPPKEEQPVEQLNLVKQWNLVAFSDAEFASDVASSKSVGGTVVFYGRSLIYANSSSQSRIATSPPGAELFQIFSAAKKMRYLQGFLGEIGEEKVATIILTDSLSTTNALKQPITTLNKHVALYLHFIKQEINNGLKVRYISRENNLADVLTKQTATNVFETQVKQMYEPFEYIHRVV